MEKEKNEVEDVKEEEESSKEVKQQQQPRGVEVALLRGSRL